MAGLQVVDRETLKDPWGLPSQSGVQLRFSSKASRSGAVMRTWLN